MLIKQTKEMTERERIAAQNSNNQYLAALSHVSVGTIYPFVGEEAPMGFMICDGSPLNKNEYSELFDVIGYTFGGSEDIFNIPDFRGKTLVGLNSSDEDFKKVGISGGEKTVKLTEEHMPKHRHKGVQWYESHPISLNSGTGAPDGYKIEWTQGIQENYSPIQTSDTGGDQPHNNMSPYAVVNYIIKVKSFPYDTDFLKTADQKYNPESENAQSGKAVAEAISNKMDKFGEVEVTDVETLLRVLTDAFEIDGKSHLILKGGQLRFESGDGTIKIIGGNFSTNENEFSFVDGETFGIRIPINVGEPQKAEHAATKYYVDNLVGNIENALDNIIEIQNSLIGGNA